MKKQSATSKYFLLSILLIAFYSCQGPEGEVGPQGPKGDQGDQGSQGSQGDQGPAGEDGNANVITSDWFNPTSYELISDNFGKDYLEYDQEAPEITEEIINSGVVLVYGQLNGYTSTIWPTNHISLLPIIITYVSGGEQKDTWSAIISVGNVKIRFVNSTNLYSSLATSHNFRYVVIPSSNATGGRTAANTRESVLNQISDAGININDVEEVIDFFED